MPFRTVLVVDDEEPLRQLLAVILRDRGYQPRLNSVNLPRHAAPPNSG